MFETFYISAQTDSAQNLIAYWEDKCGLREPVFRAKLMLAMRNGTYNDTILPYNILDFLTNYAYRMDAIRHNNYKSYDT
ncbi:MAG: hypothetical protein LBR17_06495 [Bacteroidales bacterium]|nr:hypothetical protein [Bacteroidales bacterium]